MWTTLYRYSTMHARGENWVHIERFAGVGALCARWPHAIYLLGALHCALMNSQATLIAKPFTWWYYSRYKNLNHACWIKWIDKHFYWSLIKLLLSTKTEIGLKIIFWLVSRDIKLLAAIPAPRCMLMRAICRTCAGSACTESISSSAKHIHVHSIAPVLNMCTCSWSRMISQKHVCGDKYTVHVAPLSQHTDSLQYFLSTNVHVALIWDRCIDTTERYAVV